MYNHANKTRGKPRRPCPAAVILLLAMLPFSTPADAGGIDLHDLWDDRCAECHGHSGKFARKFLRVVAGELQGRHHEHNLRQFLANHYPPGREVESLYLMLMKQTETPPRFSDECAGCHQSAAALIRESLVLDEGELVIRESKLTLRRFMQDHRDLADEDIRFYMRLLTRVSHEIYRP